jgi:hypothetical protein
VSEARWTLSVEDFGPIKSASVTLAPFTVFTGHNNTGKSYMASLIWAALNSSEILNRPGAQRGPAFDAVSELVSEIRSGRKTVVEGPDWQKLVDWLNIALNDRSLGIVGRIFACGDFRGAGCQINVSMSASPLNVKVKQIQGSEPLDGSGSVDKESGVYGTSYILDVQTFLVPVKPDKIFIDRGIRSTLMRRLSDPFGPVDYIPAARTGLMVALKTLIASLFGSMGDDDETERRSNLPLPVRRFLAAVNGSVDQPEDDHYDIARFIEREILGGRIVQAENGDFRFAFSHSAPPVPLHATSSLITELAPFIVLLKGGLRGSVIFEEPEAHLHLDAQRVLARALIRLVNTGTPVLVTTHSDTFLQQINLLMRLSTHPARDELAKEFGYDPAEFLDPAMAAGYEFIRTSDGTVVRELEKTSLGFVEPEMNQTIADLSHEILEMERRESDV